MPTISFINPKTQIPNPKPQHRIHSPIPGCDDRLGFLGIWIVGFGIWDLHTGIIDRMLRRQRTGSVICSSCGVLVGVNDDRCYNCGRRNPGMWGYAPILRSLGADLGFVPFVIGTCGIVYVLTLIASRGAIAQGGMFSFLGPSNSALILFGASGGVPVFGFGRWWTVLSAAWLHAGLLHIMFNMFAVRQLGPPTADFYGPARTILIYTAGAIAGFTLSSFAYVFLPSIDFGMLHLGGSAFTVGASASI